jgi:hypothetical protein
LNSALATENTLPDFGNTFSSSYIGPPKAYLLCHSVCLCVCVWGALCGQICLRAMLATARILVRCPMLVRLKVMTQIKRDALVFQDGVRHGTENSNP